MRRTLLAALFPILVLSLSTLAAQAPQSDDEEELLTLAKGVQAQQAQILDNQAKIEAKLADITEAVRVARIYTSRGR